MLPRADLIEHTALPPSNGFESECPRFGQIACRSLKGKQPRYRITKGRHGRRFRFLGADLQNTGEKAILNVEAARVERLRRRVVPSSDVEVAERVEEAGDVRMLRTVALLRDSDRITELMFSRIHISGGLERKPKLANRCRIQGMAIAKSCATRGDRARGCCPRLVDCASLALRTSQSDEHARVVECRRTRHARVGIDRLEQQLPAASAIVLIREMREVSERAHGERTLRSVQRALDLERALVVRFCRRTVADCLVEEAAI
ncbi:MAG TPA: hypothetical protein VF488_06320, partial [Gemmatimonadaceae bacterium]